MASVCAVQSATNFCNVNNNGNANNWNASNSIGVRPDFTTALHSTGKLPRAAMGKERPSVQRDQLVNANQDAPGYDRWGYRVVFMNVFYDANLIYDAGTKAMKSSKFKRSTQMFEMTQLLTTAHIRRDFMDGEYRPDPGNKFPINERGHQRFITSNTMVDKTVNHLFCDEVLTPAISKYLIYDNGASQKDKGVAFHRRRFEAHLHQYYMEHGSNEGYILLVDYSGYYANIPHDKCIEVLDYFLEREVEDPETLLISEMLTRLIFKTFEQDVSRFSDEEIAAMMAGKVNPMLNCGVDPELLTGEKMLRKGVDIGSQPSQNIGIIYPYRVDNYAKIVRGIKHYARYTDDFYAVSDSKEFLVSVLEGFRKEAAEYGLIINEKKTRIVKLSSQFRHLQVCYSLTESGRLIRKIHPKNITRERRKLKAYKRLLDAGRIDYPTVENSFKSWLGSHYKIMSHDQIYNMSSLYYELFGRRPKWKKGHGRLHWLMAHPSTASTLTGTTSSAPPLSPRTPSPANSPA